MKAYLLVFDPSQTERQRLLDAIDSISEIENWYAFFGDAVCLATNLTAKEISKRFRARLPEIRFMVTEVDYMEIGGRLPRSIWDFLMKPHAASVEAS